MRIEPIYEGGRILLLRVPHLKLSFIDSYRYQFTLFSPFVSSHKKFCRLYVGKRLFSVLSNKTKKNSFSRFVKLKLAKFPERFPHAVRSAKGTFPHRY